MRPAMEGMNSCQCISSSCFWKPAAEQRRINLKFRNSQEAARTRRIHVRLLLVSTFSVSRSEKNQSGRDCRTPGRWRGFRCPRRREAFWSAVVLYRYSEPQLQRFHTGAAAVGRSDTTAPRPQTECGVCRGEDQRAGDCALRRRWPRSPQPRSGWNADSHRAPATTDGAIFRVGRSDTTAPRAFGMRNSSFGQKPKRQGTAALQDAGAVSVAPEGAKRFGVR